jgi:hypothetical protein
MTDQTAADKVTLGDVLKDLGWFWGIFAFVVGGPSVLSILQAVFVDHRLIAGLQWIIDGYNGVMAVLGSVFEPLVRPLVDWLNAQLHWSLTLQPHWKPLFVLAMLFVTGLARGVWREGQHAMAIQFSATGVVAALAGALIAGLAPLSAGWWVQGLAAAIPTALVMIAFLIFGTFDLTSLAVIGMISAATFVIGAGFSFMPGLGRGAGILSLATLVMLAGVWFCSAQDAPLKRTGLTILGGFIAAGLILLADVAVKALS